MEELISRPFVGQIQFQLVLLKRIETESAVVCLIFSPMDSLPAHSLEIWLERWEILVSTKESDGCGYGCECLERVQNFQRASKGQRAYRSRLTLWCSQVFLIFPTIFPKSEPASWTALSTANFWETKKVSAREKTKQPIADSVPMCFCSTNWN